MDAWDGYPAARRRLLRSFVDGAVRNPVVLTGDVHRHYANDLLLDDRVVASELVTTSVSSGGDGAERTALTDVQLAENPHLRWVDSRRGYVMLRLGPSVLRADFRTVPFVSRPGARASTAASFGLEDGRRGLARHDQTRRTTSRRPSPRPRPCAPRRASRARAVAAATPSSGASSSTNSASRAPTPAGANTMTTPTA